MYNNIYIYIYIYIYIVIHISTYNKCYVHILFYARPFIFTAFLTTVEAFVLTLDTYFNSSL